MVETDSMKAILTEEELTELLRDLPRILQELESEKGQRKPAGLLTKITD